MSATKRVYTHSPYTASTEPLPPHPNATHQTIDFSTATPSIESTPNHVRRGHARTFSSNSHKSAVSIVSFDEDHSERDATPHESPARYSQNATPNLEFANGAEPPQYGAGLGSSLRNEDYPSVLPQRPGPGHHRKHSRQLSTGSASSNNSARLRVTPSMPNIFHTRLSGLVEFLPMPSVEQIIYEINEAPNGPETEFGLFFGQLKFEATLEQMTWLIQRLTNGEVWPVHIHPRGNGCVMAYFATEGHAKRVQAFNDRVLWDESGFWIARHQSEVAALAAYTQQIGSLLKGVRLPRGAMVIRK